MSKKERTQFEGLNINVLDDKYNISADTLQYILKNNKTKKTTYHSSLFSVLKAIKEDEIRAIKDVDFAHLLYHVTELNKTMIGIKEALEKGMS